MRTAIINVYFGLKIAFHWVTADIGRALFSCYFAVILGFGLFKAAFLFFALWPVIAAVWIFRRMRPGAGLDCGSNAKKELNSQNMKFRLEPVASGSNALRKQHARP
jgi:hypothetical protein